MHVLRNSCNEMNCIELLSQTLLNPSQCPNMAAKGWSESAQKGFRPSLLLARNSSLGPPTTEAERKPLEPKPVRWVGGGVHGGC